MADYSRALLVFAHAASGPTGAGRRLLRNAADAGHARARRRAAGRGARPRRRRGRRLERRHADRRVAEGLLDEYGHRGLVAAPSSCSARTAWRSGSGAPRRADGTSSAPANRVIWLNPLKGDEAYEPLARGMHAALPYVDLFAAGHNLQPERSSRARRCPSCSRATAPRPLADPASSLWDELHLDIPNRRGPLEGLLERALREHLRQVLAVLARRVRVAGRVRDRLRHLLGQPPRSPPPSRGRRRATRPARRPEAPSAPPTVTRALVQLPLSTVTTAATPTTAYREAGCACFRYAAPVPAPSPAPSPT